MNVFGLPLHPLVVHAAVVLVPIAALGAVLAVVFPKIRSRYGWLTAGVAVAAALSTLMARLSGPAFATSIGLDGSARIASHQVWGSWTPWPAVVLALALSIYMWSVARGDRDGAAAIRVVSAVLTIFAALTGLVLVGLTGHSGASAVWG